MANGWIKATCSEPGVPDRTVYQRVVNDAVVSYHNEDGSEFSPAGGVSMRAIGYGTDAQGSQSAHTDLPSAKPPFDTSEMDKAAKEALKSIPALSDAPPEPAPVVPPPVAPKSEKNDKAEKAGG